MATFTGANAISEFRRLIQDTAAPYRVDDPAALNLINQAQRMLVSLFPTVLQTRQSVNLVQGSRQTKPNPRSIMCRVIENQNGDRVTLVAEALLRAFNPGWMNDTSNVNVQHQVIVQGDLEHFYVYPPQPVTPGTAIVVTDLEPTNLSADSDPLSIEDVYFMAVPNIMAHIHYMEDAGVEANKVLADTFLNEANLVMGAKI